MEVHKTKLPQKLPVKNGEALRLVSEQVSAQTVFLAELHRWLHHKLHLKLPPRRTRERTNGRFPEIILDASDLS